MRLNILLLLSMSFFHVIGQDVVRINIGEKSSPLDAEVVITLKHRFQHYNSSLNSNGNTYDRSIHSPKSVNILDKKKKFYIHSLEGYITSVYSLEDFIEGWVWRKFFSLGPRVGQAGPKTRPNGGFGLAQKGSQKDVKCSRK